ncbi:hypothetical protein niasHS_012910 [Heterodera schachtii]|uniref:Gustatory receptor n=1 Tax=Heterodera schachtii TaxID=97005 RepID=A0ABD2IIQ0_HETSC
MSNSSEIFEQIAPVNVLISVLYSLNLAVFVFQMPFSLLNIGILCRTSLLHRNLKFVLLTQSVLFTVFAIGRTTQIIVILMDAEIYLPFGYKIVLFLVDFPQLFITYIGHVLFIERSIAIILFKNYENAKNALFSCVWFIVLTTYSVIISAEQSFKDQTQIKITNGALIAFYVALAISFFEIIAFSVMSTLNLKLFTSKLETQNNVHNLSERYQLAENIRTGRQLGPTFLLHFLNNCAVIVPSVLGFYQIVTHPKILEMIWVIYFLFLSISNLMIEFTTISRHPILQRDAIRILSEFFKTFSMKIPFVQRVSDPEFHRIGRIDGKIVQEKKMNEMDNYFEMLTKQW